MVHTVRAMIQAGVGRKAVGIITMYKHDAHMIRLLLAELGLWGVEITDNEDDIETATVDAFQGREKKIILVHFVAADPTGKTGLGHVANARRLCVALTRAQEYLLMFGNITHWEMHDQLKEAGRMKAVVDFCRRHRQVMEYNHVRLPQATAEFRRGRRIALLRETEESNIDERA